MTRLVVLLAALAATHPALDCAHQPAACQAALAWSRERRRHDARQIHRLRAHLARVHAPTVREAALLAGHALHIDGEALYRVAACETGQTFDPYAYNASSGASGPWQFLASTWSHTPFAAWPRTNPFAAALAAAQIVSADGGYTQWSCKP